MGSAYEIAVQLPSSVVTVKTGNSHHQQGEEIYLSLSPGDVWYA
jgi:hypothetical protein